MRNFLKSRWFYRLLALFFALLLFFNANSGGNRSASSTAQTYNETLHNIPIQVLYDQDKYFISGFDDNATVYLSSTNLFRLKTETTESTRNFRVVADVQNAGVGTVEVPLRVQGLNNSVSAEIEPTSVSITVEEKNSKQFTVEPVIPDDLTSDGFEVHSATVSPKQVAITTGAETMQEIDKVVATLPSGQNQVSDFSQKATVQALDKDGHVLPAVIDPAEVTVNVSLEAPVKTVTIKPVASGTQPGTVAHYAFTLSQDTVEIHGGLSVLQAIDQIEVPVDITNQLQTETKNVRVPDGNGYTVTPAQIEIHVVPVLKPTDSSTSSSPPQSSTTTESTSTSTATTTETQTSESTSQESQSSTD